MGSTPASLPVALAAWMSRRLLDTIASPLDATRLYGLTIIDPAGLDPERMAVRAALLGPRATPSTRRREERPDAIAVAARRWSLPALGGVEQLVRPRAFASRRPALAVGVVCDDGLGAVVRFEHAPDGVIVADPRPAGLLLPAVLRWRAYDGPHEGSGAA